MAVAQAEEADTTASAVRLGEGSVGMVNDGRIITAGRHTHIPEDLDCDIDLEVGSFCSIASGLVIVSGQHPGVDDLDCVSNFPFFEAGWGEYPHCRDGAKTSIGNDVWVGRNVTIMEGVRVGDGAVLAAGAVVSANVLPYAIVAGNPARMVKLRFRASQISRLMQIKWWDWPDEKIKESLAEMAYVAEFVRFH